MSTWLKAVSLSVFAFIVAAALAVGAHTAFAQSRTADCTYDPPVYLGSCIDTPDCTLKCRQYSGPEAEGRCQNGCCICLF